jgi:hypothetical protein
MKDEPALSRRALLRGAAATAIGGAAAPALAQVGGTGPEGGTVPFRMPAGVLDHLDRKQYIHNMTIVAHLSGAHASGGEPLTSMWAKGRQRCLFGDGGFIDITEPTKPFVRSKRVVQGGQSCVVYNTRLKKWIVVSSAAAPLTDPTPEFPRGKYHPEWAAHSTSYKGLRGIRSYDASNPEKPVLLQEFNTGATGNGTHMNSYDGGRYAYLDCGWDDKLRLENCARPYSNALMIVDMSDPANIKEVSRWWVPGQRIGEEEDYKKYYFAGDQSSWTGIHGAPILPVRVEDGGKLGYSGWGIFGMYIHDFSDITKPKVVGRLWNPGEGLGGIPYHTVFPLHPDPAHPKLSGLLVAVPETIEPDCRESFHIPYVVDIKDPRNPRIIGYFPRPVAPTEAPYADFCQARGRFGSHNAQSWVAPGRARANIVALSYFNAGVRLYDISDPTRPTEIAWFVPPRDGEIEEFESWWRGTSENVFIEWDRNLIWLTTHEGIYALSTPALGKPVLEPRKIERWTSPHINQGWDI